MANPVKHTILIHKCLANNQWHIEPDKLKTPLKKADQHTDSWYRTRKPCWSAFFRGVLSLFRINVWHHWPAALTHNIAVIRSFSCPVDLILTAVEPKFNVNTKDGRDKGRREDATMMTQIPLTSMVRVGTESMCTGFSSAFQIRYGG